MEGKGFIESGILWVDSVPGEDSNNRQSYKMEDVCCEPSVVYKQDGESMDQLLLHCPVMRELKEFQFCCIWSQVGDAKSCMRSVSIQALKTYFFQRQGKEYGSLVF